MPNDCACRLPITVLSTSTRSSIEPVAFDCVTVIVVRSGGALLLSDFGTRHVNVGDVVVLAANTLCGVEPEGWITVTTLYLDTDFVVDQVFWQHAEQFIDRLSAKQFLEAQHTEPAQIVRLGEARSGMLMPWLDELTSISVDGLTLKRFYRVESLLFAVLDVIVPRIAAENGRVASNTPAASSSVLPRHGRLVPLRKEARDAESLLRAAPAQHWTLLKLAKAVHLSSSQLGRVFVDAFGKSPIAYLAMLRVERMAHLLRSTDEPVALIARRVGWGDPDFAAQQFRHCIGVTPSRYRKMSWQGHPGTASG